MAGRSCRRVSVIVFYGKGLSSYSGFISPCGEIKLSSWPDFHGQSIPGSFDISNRNVLAILAEAFRKQMKVNVPLDFQKAFLDLDKMSSAAVCGQNDEKMIFGQDSEDTELRYI
jgi:hypothetical protein